MGAVKGMRKGPVKPSKPVRQLLESMAAGADLRLDLTSCVAYLYWSHNHIPLSEVVAMPRVQSALEHFWISLADGGAIMPYIWRYRLTAMGIRQVVSTEKVSTE